MDEMKEIFMNDLSLQKNIRNCYNTTVVSKYVTLFLFLKLLIVLFVLCQSRSIFPEVFQKVDFLNGFSKFLET